MVYGGRKKFSKTTHMPRTISVMSRLRDILSSTWFHVGVVSGKGKGWWSTGRGSIGAAFCSLVVFWSPALLVARARATQSRGPALPATRNKLRGKTVERINVLGVLCLSTLVVALLGNVPLPTGPNCMLPSKSKSIVSPNCCGFVLADVRLCPPNLVVALILKGCFNLKSVCGEDGGPVWVDLFMWVDALLTFGLTGIIYT